MHFPPVEGVGEGEGEGDLGVVQVQDESDAQVPALTLAAQQAAGTRRCAVRGWCDGCEEEWCGKPLGAENWQAYSSRNPHAKLAGPWLMHCPPVIGVPVPGPPNIWRSLRELRSQTAGAVAGGGTPTACGRRCPGDCRTSCASHTPSACMPWPVWPVRQAIDEQPSNNRGPQSRGVTLPGLATIPHIAHAIHVRLRQIHSPRLGRGGGDGQDDQRRRQQHTGGRHRADGLQTRRESKTVRLRLLAACATSECC